MSLKATYVVGRLERLRIHTRGQSFENQSSSIKRGRAWKAIMQPRTGVKTRPLSRYPPPEGKHSAKILVEIGAGAIDVGREPTVTILHLDTGGRVPPLTVLSLKQFSLKTPWGVSLPLAS